MKSHSKLPVVGVLIANTTSRRSCCNEKWAKKLMGRSVLSHVIERVSPQVSTLIINANGDPTRFQDTGLPVVPDALDEHPGILTGILTGMEWANAYDPHCQWIATFSTDYPFIPENLVLQLLTEIERQHADMAYVSCAGKPHPQFGLWPIELEEDLRNALLEEDIRCVDKWTALYHTVVVDYPSEPIDLFTYNNSMDGIVSVTQSAAAH